MDKDDFNAKLVLARSLSSAACFWSHSKLKMVKHWLMNP